MKWSQKTHNDWKIIQVVAKPEFFKPMLGLKAEWNQGKTWSRGHVSVTVNIVVVVIVRWVQGVKKVGPGVKWSVIHYILNLVLSSCPDGFVNNQFYEFKWGGPNKTDTGIVQLKHKGQQANETDPPWCRNAE